jgi:anti-anti-sigma factor
VELSQDTVEIAGLDVLVLRGDVDLATLPLLHGALQRLVDGRRGEVVLVDIDGLVLVDDAALGLLLGAAGRAREADGDLEIVCTATRLLDRIMLCRLDRAVKIRSRASDRA